MKTIETKAPGKLYIAGEYAVVEPGHTAIITAVNSFVTARISASDNEHGSIYSEGFTSEPVGWSRTEDKVTLVHSESDLKYVLAAIQKTEAYLAENDYELVYFDLDLNSELDDESGNKFGLGSSGAVTVATVKAVLKLYGAKTSDLLVFKLSVLAQMSIGVNSSFGDIAASTYTGWIQYTSFDRDFVRNIRDSRSISETVDAYWPKIMIKRMKVAKRLLLLVGWTGSPASSHHLVGSVQEKKEQTAEQYEHFLQETKDSITLLTIGLEENNPKKIKDAIRRNRKALMDMSEQTGVVIETPLLKELCQIAIRHGGAAKTSGAGGGDSGIAFVFSKKHIKPIKDEWKNKGITPLPLRVYKE